MQRLALLRICLLFIFASALLGAPANLQVDTKTHVLTATDGSTIIDAKGVTLTVGGMTIYDGAGVKTIVTGSTSGAMFGASGNKIGFLGATPIIRPIGTTDLRQALINLGLYATGGASPLNLNGGAFTSGPLSSTTGAFSSTLGITGALSGSSFSFSSNGTISGTLAVTGAGTFATVNTTNGYYIGTDLILTHPLTPSPDNDARTNIGLGFGTLGSITPIHSTQYLTAVGYNAMAYVTTADHNTAVGAWALSADTTGSSNTAVGIDSLRSNTSGHENTAIGEHAITSDATATANTSVGNQSMYYAGGEFNVAVGYAALLGNSTGSPLTGRRNVSIGPYTLKIITGAASDNTAIGTFAGYGVTTGNNNLFLGGQAGTSYPATGSDNILIGTPGNVVNTAGENSSFTLNIANVIKAGGLDDPAHSSVTLPGMLAVNGAFGGFPFSVKTGTNHQLVIEDVAGSPRIRVMNDAQSANMPLEIYSTGTVLSGGTVTVASNATIAGALTVVGGILQTPEATISSSTYNMLPASPVVHFDGTGTTVTFLNAAAYSGIIIYLHTYTASAVVSSSSNVIDLLGNATTSVLPATAGKWAQLQSDGTYWRMIAAN